jgi:hypothetical protein
MKFGILILRILFIAMMMDTVHRSETSVYFETTLHYIPEKLSTAGVLNLVFASTTVLF